MPSIPLSLIAGFLGSGKTSFLMHYLETFSGSRKIGVIQNEFAASGIDSQLIINQNRFYKLLEINNGSVFCVCLLGSFIESLSEFIKDHSPDEIIMEASGMSDPVSISQIFQSPVLRNRVFLHTSYVLVDALNFHKLTVIRDRLIRQIRIADVIILNKTDKAGKNVDQLASELRKINPFSPVIPAEYGRINFVDYEKKQRLLPVPENSFSTRPPLQSYVIKSRYKIDREKLAAFLENEGKKFIRLKGFINLSDGTSLMLQGIFGEYFLEETPWFDGISELAGILESSHIQNYTNIYEKYCGL